MNINTSTSRRSTLYIVGILALPIAAPVFAATLPVGPGKTYATPCGAFAAAGNGDTIEIDASGSYDGDVCGIYPSNLIIRGVNGRPKINAGGANPMGKGTWVVSGTNTVIENVEMFGANVPDRNGAAIRLDGYHLTLRGSYLHDNENGILTNHDGVSNIVIENSEFARNGYGDGYSHNLNIGRVNSLIFRGSYSHDANIGHNLRSRANTNTIVYSRFSSSVNRPSYEIDLPDAGTSYVIGNVIQQPASNDNAAMLAYGAEGASNTGSDLYVINNTFLNEDSVLGTFVAVGDGVGTPVLMQNNIFSGTGSASNQSNAIDRNNYRTLSPSVINLAGYDLHPAPGSPMIDAGAAVGASASGISLKPTAQYTFPVGTEPRPSNGVVDIGAYEASAAAVTPVTITPILSDPVVIVQGPVLAPASPIIDNGWVQCALENGICSFTGTRQVRYGASGVYSYRTATGSIACNNATFGDPLPGTIKTCYYNGATVAATPAIALGSFSNLGPLSQSALLSGFRRITTGVPSSFNLPGLSLTSVPTPTANFLDTFYTGPR